MKMAHWERTLAIWPHDLYIIFSIIKHESKKYLMQKAPQ